MLVVLIHLNSANLTGIVELFVSYATMVKLDILEITKKQEAKFV